MTENRKARNGEVPGNSLASQRMFEEHLFGIGRGWTEMVRALGNQTKAGIEVYRITIKGDLWSGHDVLVVLCAYSETGNVVAFHKVEDMTTLWVGLSNRIKNGSLKWKEDQYERT